MTCKTCNDSGHIYTVAYTRLTPPAETTETTEPTPISFALEQVLTKCPYCSDEFHTEPAPNPAG